MKKTDNNVTTYTFGTLEEIQMRKDQLTDAIDTDSEKIAALWNELFKKREDSSKGEYIASIVTNTITAVDAFLMVRKLMKNYSGMLSFFKLKKTKKH